MIDKLNNLFNQSKRFITPLIFGRSSVAIGKVALNISKVDAKGINEIELKLCFFIKKKVFIYSNY